MRTPRLPRTLFALLLMPTLMASKCNKNKDTQDTDIEVDIPPPAETLQVASIDPDRVWIGDQTRAVVFGAGFEEGARVWVDNAELGNVAFRDENRLAVSVPPLSAGAHDVRVRNPDGTTAMLRSGLVARQKLTQDPTKGLQCEQITVSFEYDRATVTEASASELQKHLACFTTREGTIRVEGHCDERGTTDYNLALGQRRADSVKRWLTSNGVPPARVRAVSYGEERPANKSHNESAWAINRRAELFPSK